MTKNKHKILGIFLSLMMAFGFAGQTFAAAPTVATDAATSVADTTATLNGTVSSDGGSALTVRGFEYGLDTNYGTTTTESGVVSISYASQFGTYGSGNGEFDGPYGVAIDASGNIYVVDGNNNRVQKFNSSGVYQSQFGSSGSGNGQFNTPRGIAFDPSGNIFVVDTFNNRIQKFNSSGVYQAQYTGFLYPVGIGIDSSGNMYIGDQGNSRIRKLDSSGNVLGDLATNGSGDGQVSQAYNAIVDSSDNIFVVDTYNHRIQKFNSAGVFQFKFGTQGSGNGQFGSYNSGIGIDSDGNIYAADNGNNRFQMFNNLGVYQDQFGSAGSGNGEFSGASGLAIDSSDNIYVSDFSNHRIQKFNTPHVLSTGAYTKNITGLSCGTTYHYRAYATNGDGTSYGGDSTFTTDDCAPTVTTSSASSITKTTLTLNGSITETGGENATVRGFNYGPDDSYGTTTTENGNFSTGAFSANITGLTCNTTYHFQSYATNTIGTSYSSDSTFTTSPCAPTVTTNTPKYVSDTSQILKGEITNTGGENATARGFDWGTDTNYGTNVPESGSFGTGIFSATITGLTEGATYHYRSYATNSGGTTYGNDTTFVAGALTSISSCAEFQSINDDTDTLDGSYILTRDLDCRSEGNNIMVGTSDPFTGIFNGDGHTITVNIHSLGNSNIGLFSQASSPTISNLNIAGVVAGGQSTGALIGSLENVANSDNPITTISNVHSTANVNSASPQIGGLIGYIDNEGNGEDSDTTAVNITNSSSTGSVTGSGGSSQYIGGLIGYIYQDYTANTSITNSYATGNVTAGYYAGGLIGYYDHNDGNITITDNHYSGDILTTDDDYVGGLIGYIYAAPSEGYDDSTVTITNNFTTGSITSENGNYVGGVIGYFDIENYQDFPMTINFENNYSTSSIDGGGRDNIGGLVGYVYLYNDYTSQPVIFNFNQNYYEGTVLNTDSSVGGLIGYIRVSSDNITSALSKNYVSATITSVNSEIGGLIGYIENAGDIDIAISDSYFSGGVTGLDSAGGLVGLADSSTAAELTIDKSYAKGTVTGTDPLNSNNGGGLIGVVSTGDSSITDSFAAVLVSDFNSAYGAVVGAYTNTPTISNAFFDQITSGGYECADDSAVTGCTPVNTTGSPDSSYFITNHTNAPLDQWDFNTTWTNKAGINDDYPVFPNTTAGLSILPATSITGTTATLNATLVSTGGQNNTTRGFNYGLTTSYGTTTTETGSFGTGSFSANITGLTACTTYHYRAYTINANSVTSYSSDKTFNTCGSTVVTLGANTLSSSSAQLNGNITNLNGSNATARGFEYGLTTSYGTTLTDTGSFSTGQYFLTASSIAPDTTYHYRAYATNNAGTTYGDDATFSVSSMTTISTCAEFEAIDTDTGTLDGKYLLTTDLDCSSRHENIMIGESNPFTGVFDGGGHTITVSMHDSGTSYLALFSQTSGASISNLNIAGSIIGRDYVGSLIGKLDNSDGGQVATISNVHSTATVIGTQAYVGGLIGEVDNQGNGQYFDTTAVNIINSSHASGVVGGTYYIGGLVGYIQQDSTANTNIINSYANGSVTGDQGYVGGLVGEFDQYDGNITMTGNYFSGTVDGDDTDVGGLVGYMYIYPSGNYADSVVNISNNYSTGTVSGDGETGGIFGYLYIENNQEYPLIVNVEDNYSTANVTSSNESVGGLIGYLYTANNYTSYPVTFNFNQNYVESTVTSSGSNNGYVGGLIGYVDSQSDNINATLSKNYFYGIINTNFGYDVGGLIGYHYDGGNTPWTISDSYAVLDITADYNIGGILGEGSTFNGLNINRVYAVGTIIGSDALNSYSAGGLVGTAASNQVITDSFAGVTLANFDSVRGAFIGVQNDTTLTNNYFDQNINQNLGLDCTGSGTATGCTPVDTVASAYFKSNHINAPLNNWSFGTVWRNKTGVNDDYPVFVSYYPITIPTMATGAASQLTTTTAILSGSITSNGTEDSSLRGFNYGVTDSYGSVVSESGSFGVGSYSLRITNLTCGTIYHYRSFSANSAGIGYGADATFTPPCPGIVPQNNNGGGPSNWYIPSNQVNTNTVQNTKNPIVKFQFTKNLKYKIRDLQVIELQKFLNNNGFPVSKSGVGSIGKETNYFGLATRNALVKFQKAKGIKPSVGYFGPVTRSLVNSLNK